MLVFFRLRLVSRVPRRLPTDSYFEISSDGLRCKSWVPVLSLRQGAARTSKEYRSSQKSYWALHSQSRVNYTIFFGCREIENASKYCDSIVYLCMIQFLCIFFGGQLSVSLRFYESYEISQYFTVFHSKDSKKCFGYGYEVRCGKGFEGVVNFVNFFHTCEITILMWWLFCGQTQWWDGFTGVSIFDT